MSDLNTALSNLQLQCSSCLRSRTSCAASFSGRANRSCQAAWSCTPRNCEMTAHWYIFIGLYFVSTLQHCPEFDDDRETLAVVGQSARPVLVLWGDHDHTIPRASIDATVTLLPRARLRVFDGLRHSLLVTHPREVNAEIVAFLGPEASL